MSITIIHDPARYGSLVRVERDRRIGYMPIVELANHILDFSMGRTRSELANLQWIDMLAANHIAIGVTPIRGDLIYVFVKPRRDVPILFRATLLGPINIPPCLWVVKFSNRRYVTSRLAVVDQVPKSMTEVRRFAPWNYGNIYHNCDVCWGTLPTVQVTMDAPQEVDAVFFSSPFNGDLVHQSGFGDLQQFKRNWTASGRSGTPTIDFAAPLGEETTMEQFLTNRINMVPTT